MKWHSVVCLFQPIWISFRSSVCVHFIWFLDRGTGHRQISHRWFCAINSICNHDLSGPFRLMLLDRGKFAILQSVNYYYPLNIFVFHFSSGWFNMFDALCTMIIIINIRECTFYVRCSYYRSSFQFQWSKQSGKKMRAMHWIIYVWVKMWSMIKSRVCAL